MTHDEIKELAENNLEAFIRLVAPQECMGVCHREVIDWWERPDAKSHQLLLFPRDHGKSRYIGYRVAHALTKDPTLRILYVSATSTLAEKQLGFIKGILTSPIYRRYWPDHVEKEVGKRKKWTNTEISLDHPLREQENIRDSSIFCAGLTTSITGLHCDIAVLDDIVVHENAYTEEGRQKVQRQYSLLSSIEGADAKEWVVGTRYHPKDLYNDMLSMKEEIYDKDGELIDEDSIYEILEKPVEDIGDGTGEFLWPRQQRSDGKWFGFDVSILAKKRGKYLDRMQFRAQYYNDPSDPDNRPVDYDKFQYFKPEALKQRGGQWFYYGRRLNIIAAVDFAFSSRIKADHSCVLVAGVDEDNNYYVMDIARFKTDSISEYFKHILQMHNKWGFKKLVAETSAAQQAIVKSLKQDYFAPNGLYVSVIEEKPNRHSGTKEERISSTLIPRYENKQMYHYTGGNIQALEEELVTANPAHDDVKDALAYAVTHLTKPAKRSSSASTQNNVVFHPRFGGVSH